MVRIYVLMVGQPCGKGGAFIKADELLEQAVVDCDLTAGGGSNLQADMILPIATRQPGSSPK